MTRSLLLVDDDDDMRTALTHFLADDGFAVHTARNGREALTLLAEIESPGLILLDLMLPDGNDAELEALMQKWRDGHPYNPRGDLG